ncbi:hypothetical protein MMC25_006654 [Agyrium rufum]|nr:hypothetical protein [Agyrium rufum]
MSEYWKSTPKYWCKHCKTYVRDTKLERQNHDATGKHQGNLKRFLRDLHRGHEKDEREKQKAKDEVARLNGEVKVRLATGMSSAPSGSASQRQVTAGERQQQLKQLAEMGIAIPEEFRKDMVMAGDWTVISETPIYEQEEVKKEEEEDSKSNLAVHSVGVRRKRNENDAEEEELPARRKWRQMRHHDPDADKDLDALLASTAASKHKSDEKSHEGPNLSNQAAIRDDDNIDTTPAIKHEPSDGGPPQLDTRTDRPLKEEDDTDIRVVFKKRKSKATRAS